MKLKLNMEKYLLTYLVNSRIIISNPDLYLDYISVYINNLFFEQYKSSGIVFLQNNHLVQMLPIDLVNNISKQFEIIKNNDTVRMVFNKQDVVIKLDKDEKYFKSVKEVELAKDKKKIKCLKIDI